MVLGPMDSASKPKRSYRPPKVRSIKILVPNLFACSPQIGCEIGPPVCPGEPCPGP